MREKREQGPGKSNLKEGEGNWSWSKMDIQKEGRGEREREGRLATEGYR